MFSVNMLKENVLKNIKHILKSFKYLEPRILYRKPFSTDISVKTQPNPRWNVLFFGTDEFSVASLRKLHNAFKDKAHVKNLEVVTNIRNKPNPVQQFAGLSKLKLHNYRDLEASDIQNRLFDIGIVVSFGNLIPASIINAFPLGILNVHASLLPKWRGAAPIIHAIASGETETGVTIMKIKPHKFDTGEIIAQRSTAIPSDVLLPELTKRLSEIGADCLFECFSRLPMCLEEAKPQPDIGKSFAPRVHQDSGRISWSTMNATKIYNLYRALNGLFPLQSTWMGHPVKFFDIRLFEGEEDSVSSGRNMAGFTVFNKKENELRIQCFDGMWIVVNKLSVGGRKPISCKDFYNGFMSKYHPKSHVFH